MEFVEHLKSNRPTKGPLPSWKPTTQIGIALMRTFQESVKDNVHLAQKLTQFIHPTHPKTNITHLQIPRRSDIVPDGLPPDQATGTLNAELLEWKHNQIYSSTHSRIADPHESVIIFAHGGAFFTCAPSTHRGMTWRLSKYAQANVLSIDYRLSPQFLFPAALHDMISAFFFLIDPPPGHVKYLPSQIAFAGDSAGGNLAMATTIFLRDSVEKYPMPATLTLISPWLDLTNSNPSYHINGAFDIVPLKSNDKRFIHVDREQYYVTNNDLMKHPLVSPIFSKETSRPLPNILIQIGDAERLRDGNILFYNKFKNTSIQMEMFEDGCHVFHQFAVVNRFWVTALKRMGTFIIDSQLSPNSIRRKFTWVKTNHDVELHDPISIVEYSKEIALKTGKWTMQMENTYQEASLV